jgi:hypothetical protein
MFHFPFRRARYSDVRQFIAYLSTSFTLHGATGFHERGSRGRAMAVYLQNVTQNIITKIHVFS